MIKRIGSFLLTVALCSLISIVVSDFIVRAGSLSDSTITVMATIQPQRIIVVDKNLTIKTILSNTSQDVRPIVFLESLDGKLLPYSESIIEQYSVLKPSLELSKPGVVYEAKPFSLRSFISARLLFR